MPSSGDPFNNSTNTTSTTNPNHTGGSDDSSLLLLHNHHHRDSHGLFRPELPTSTCNFRVNLRTPQSSGGRHARPPADGGRAAEVASWLVAEQGAFGRSNTGTSSNSNGSSSSRHHGVGRGGFGDSDGLGGDDDDLLDEDDDEYAAWGSHNGDPLLLLLSAPGVTAQSQPLLPPLPQLSASDLPQPVQASQVCWERAPDIRATLHTDVFGNFLLPEPPNRPKHPLSEETYRQ